MRQALASLGVDAAPLAIRKFVKDNFDQDMDTNIISSYKSSLRSDAGIKAIRRGRGRPRKEETVASPTGGSRIYDAVPWKDLRSIKEIAGRIGKKGLRELVDLLD